MADVDLMAPVTTDDHQLGPVARESATPILSPFPRVVLALSARLPLAAECVEEGPFFSPECDYQVARVLPSRQQVVVESIAHRAMEGTNG